MFSLANGLPRSSLPRCRTSAQCGQRRRRTTAWRWAGRSTRRTAFRAKPARRGPCRSGERSAACRAKRRVAEKCLTRARREVEGRRPIVCMLSVSAAALLVAVGLYSHYCPCWVRPPAHICAATLALPLTHHHHPHPRPFFARTPAVASNPQPHRQMPTTALLALASRPPSTAQPLVAPPLRRVRQRSGGARTVRTGARRRTRPSSSASTPTQSTRGPARSPARAYSRAHRAATQVRPGCPSPSPHHHPDPNPSPLPRPNPSPHPHPNPSPNQGGPREASPTPNPNPNPQPPTADPKQAR